MTDTGYSKSVVTDVLSYLQSVGVMYNVPVEHRVGQEKAIHGNRKVWQMTGIIAIGSEIIDYLYIKDSDRTSAYQEIAEHAHDDVKVLYAKLGVIDLGSQNEPISTEEISSQNEPKVIQFGSQNGLEIGSQNTTAKEVNTNKDNTEKENTIIAVPQDEPTNGKAKQLISTYKSYAKNKDGSMFTWALDDAKNLIRAGIILDDVKHWYSERSKDEWIIENKNGVPTWRMMVTEIITHRDKRQIYTKQLEIQQRNVKRPLNYDQLAKDAS
jgi:hypothetical protein